MRGRKPRPTHQKIQEGEKNLDRINLDEPCFMPEFPTCPDDLEGDAKKEWNRIEGLMDGVPNKYITKLDEGALLGHCVSKEIFLRCYRAGAAKAPVIKTTQGNYIQNPALGTMRKALEMMIKCDVELGWTPSARSRVRAPKRKGKDDGGLEDALD